MSVSRVFRFRSIRGIGNKEFFLANSRKSLGETFIHAFLYILKDWSTRGYNHSTHSKCFGPLPAPTLVTNHFLLLRLLLL